MRQTFLAIALASSLAASLAFGQGTPVHIPYQQSGTPVMEWSSANTYEAGTYVTRNGRGCTSFAFQNTDTPETSTKWHCEPLSITLTTSGTSGAATLSAAGVLNVPQYSGAGGGASAVGQLSGVDGLATSDRRNNPFEQVECALIAHSIITPYPADGSIMHAAGSEYGTDGAFPADEYYSIAGAPSCYSPAEKLNAISKHTTLVDSNGNIPQTVLANGTVLLWDSNYDGSSSGVNGQPAKHLMGESAQFLSAILRFYVDDCAGATTTSKCAVSGTSAYNTYAPILAKALGNFVTDSGNSLIYVSSSAQWIPCDGYTESWRPAGDSPCGSVWTAKAWTDLAYAATKAGDLANASTYQNKASAIINSLSSLVDSSNGDLFYFSSTQTSIHDVRDSLWACYFGFLNSSQCSTMGSYLHNHLSSLMAPNGYIRFLDGNAAPVIGNVNSNGTSNIGNGGLGLTGYNYQAGAWGMLMGPAAYVLGLSGNQADVNTMLTDYYGSSYPPGTEWIDGNNAANTPTPCTTSNCGSSSGTTVPIAHLMSSASGAAIAANLFPVAVQGIAFGAGNGNSGLSAGIGINGTDDVYFNPGGTTPPPASATGTILTHTGEYFSASHATAPTGSCGLNGMFAFSQDGITSVCQGGSWSAAGGGLPTGLYVNGTDDVYLGGGTTPTTAANILTHTGEYFSEHATTPTGSCGLNGMWAFPQSGNPAQCLSGTWTTFSTSLPSGLYVNGTEDVAVGGGTTPSNAANFLTHTGEYYGAHATAPTGSCGLNGMWAFSQDGHASVCLSGGWVQKL